MASASGGDPPSAPPSSTPAASASRAASIAASARTSSLRASGANGLSRAMAEKRWPASERTVSMVLRDGLEARRREGHGGGGAGVDHPLGDEEGERVRMRHHAVVALGRLQDDLASDALVELACGFAGLRMRLRRAHDDAERSLGEREAQRPEERVRPAPRDRVAEHLGEDGRRQHLHAADVEHDLRRVEVGPQIEEGRAHAGDGDRHDHEPGALRQVADRSRAELPRDVGVLVVRAVRDSGLREELPERPSEAPVAKQGHGFTRHARQSTLRRRGCARPSAMASLGACVSAVDWVRCCSSWQKAAALRAAVVVTPAAGPAAVCPIAGCGAAQDGPASATGDARRRSVRAAGDAPCAGAQPSECAARALAAWSEATDERDVACVARMLADACALAGRARVRLRRAALARRPRDPARRAARARHARCGPATAACHDLRAWSARAGSARAATPPTCPAARSCSRGSRESAPVWRARRRRASRSASFSTTVERRSRATARAPRGRSRGDATWATRGRATTSATRMAYGDGVSRDVEDAASSFGKACRLGEALGCANLGYMVEHGEGVPRDVARARRLYRDACAAGEVYGCLHRDLLAAEDAGAPRDPDRALAHWRHACEQRARREGVRVRRRHVRRRSRRRGARRGKVDAGDVPRLRARRAPRVRVGASRIPD